MPSIFKLKPQYYYIIIIIIGLFIFLIGLALNPPYRDYLINISASFVFSIISIAIIDSYKVAQEKQKRAQINDLFLESLSTLTNALIHDLRSFYEINHKFLISELGFPLYQVDNKSLRIANHMLLQYMLEINTDKKYYKPANLKLLEERFIAIHKELEKFILRYSVLNTIEVSIYKTLFELLDYRTSISSLSVLPELKTQEVVINNEGKDLAPKFIAMIQKDVEEYLKSVLVLNNQLREEYEKSSNSR